MMHAHNLARMQQTIVAQSTARGLGAIAIVRLSGNDAFVIGASLGCVMQRQKPYKLLRVLLKDAAGSAIDDAMAVAMPGPKSYTGEDLLELQVHGGEAVVAAVLAACMAAGARAAEPGEFTLRAFAHGRLDLAQAEAVGALIHAQSDGARMRALAALRGDRSESIHAALEVLEGIAAAWLAQLDFPDDTLDGPGYGADDAGRCARVVATLEQLIDTMAEDDDRPPQVVLMGAVNTGKSTLTNALCGYDRALVDAAAGTTRDSIEVALRWHGQRLALWDTAGHREGAEGVEARGITLGIERAKEAALIVWLCHGRQPVWPPRQLGELTAPLLLFCGQSDTLDEDARAAFVAKATAQGHVMRGFVSGQTHEGIGQLRQLVCEGLNGGRGSKHSSSAGSTMGNLRHRQGLGQALEALGHVRAAMAAKEPLDLALCDLQVAVRALGEIVGRDVDAGVIDRIFSDFCIGK